MHWEADLLREELLETQEQCCQALAERDRARELAAILEESGNQVALILGELRRQLHLDDPEARALLHRYLDMAHEHVGPCPKWKDGRP